MSAAQRPLKNRCKYTAFLKKQADLWKKMLLLQAETIRFEMDKQQVQKIVAAYFANQPVLKAWLFGSFARGEETPLSDVDILVVLDRSKPIGLKFFGMWNDLEELLDRKVDLVTERSLAPFAVESANRDKILIYERAA